VAKIPGLDGVEIFTMSEFLDMATSQAEEDDRVDQFTTFALAFLLAHRPGMQITISEGQYKDFQARFGQTRLHYHTEDNGDISVALELMKSVVN
jgi:hypothetical protein